jgi:hypothetical protein
VAEPEVRLHDVTVTGDVDRAALLAAVQRAVAGTASAGVPTTAAVEAAVAAATAEASSR